MKNGDDDDELKSPAMRVREAKIEMEFALLQAFQKEVNGFQEKTGLVVTGVEVEMADTQVVGGNPHFTVTGVRTRVSL